jgi:hypothetical protein
MSTSPPGAPDDSDPKRPPLRRESRVRYDAVLATFIAVLAVTVSGYTAYVQRQQVRAQVWPVLEFASSNEPELRFDVSNKGVGPAILKDVIVTADGAPVATWNAALNRLLGSAKYAYLVSNIGNHVLSAGESKVIFTLRDEAATNGPVGPPGSISARFNEARFRVGVAICYCSTLGECWTLLVKPPDSTTNLAVPECPAKSAATFQQ